MLFPIFRALLRAPINKTLQILVEVSIVPIRDDRMFQEWKFYIDGKVSSVSFNKYVVDTWSRIGVGRASRLRHSHRGRGRARVEGRGARGTGR